MNLQGVTITVSDLIKAKSFYESVLGFVPDISYEPTKWQSYKLDEGSGFFAIQELKGYRSNENANEIDFTLIEIEGLWNKIRETVTVIEPLEMKSWRSYKFVIADPDGNKLGFVQSN